MLHSMSSVIPIDPNRTSEERPVKIGATPPSFGVDDLTAAVDEHTRKLLARGRLEHRGWLVPRSLLAADLAGLTLAYLIATLFWGRAGAFGSIREIVVFLFTLPCWVIVAKLQGLYRSDQEHADHSTSDDVVGVFHLVTIGVWFLVVAGRLAGRPSTSNLGQPQQPASRYAEQRLTIALLDELETDGRLVVAHRPGQI